MYLYKVFFLMIRRPPRSTQGVSSAASDVYKRQVSTQSTWERKNFETLEAKNGVEALKIAQTLLRQSQRLLILMDFEMPEMDGIESTRRIRKIPTHIPPIIVAVTAYTGEEERKKM
eukprot:TRINITY_DN10423_c0_g1_i1.p1 TRINITY_DN10423_c0_g1~~TRINITY_DN10423_c0_g1_i1.p1  ORF type:complete len:116 (-),score=39.68 TRINITY_DN10423_c0_g1_i1:120-467(-)